MVEIAEPNTSSADPETVEPPKLPTITITFAGVGAADCRIEATDDIEAAQVYGAAYLFDLWAREVRQSLLTEAAMRAAQRQQLVRDTAAMLHRERRPS